MIIKCLTILKLVKNFSCFPVPEKSLMLILLSENFTDI